MQKTWRKLGAVGEQSLGKERKSANEGPAEVSELYFILVPSCLTLTASAEWIWEQVMLTTALIQAWDLMGGSRRTREQKNWRHAESMKNTRTYITFYDGLWVIFGTFSHAPDS